MGDATPRNSGNRGGTYTTLARRINTDLASASGGVVVPHSSSRGGGVPIHYPQLTDTNYGLWAVKMKLILRSLRCWSVVEEKGEFEPAKDDYAFAALSQSVPDSMVMALTEYETAV
jgi:hypothetical protein